MQALSQINPMNQDELKALVGQAALHYVVPGQIVGVGTGSTVNKFIEALASMKNQIKGAVSSSEASTARLKALGIPVFDSNEVAELAVYIDGADEINGQGHMVKGGGAALFREKVLAAASDRLIIVVDSTKLVTRLGSTRGIPVEVLPFATGACIRQIAEMGGEAIVRTKNESPVVTDNGNWVLDVTFDAEAMANPRALDTAMRAIPGVIITGLFWSFDATVVVGTQRGTEVLGPPL